MIAAATQIEQLKQVADYATLQNDRWLFIAMLVIFLNAMYFTVRWGMRQLDKRDTKIEDLTKDVATARSEFNTFLISAVKELSAVISKNTEVIKENTEMSDRKLAILDRVDRTLSAKQI